MSLGCSGLINRVHISSPVYESPRVDLVTTPNLIFISFPQVNGLRVCCEAYMSACIADHFLHMLVGEGVFTFFAFLESLA